MNDKQKAYEKFKLQWMINHGYTLTDLINELEKMRHEEDDMALQTLFADWEYGFGFSSEIWPCFEEYLECEYLEEN